MFVAVRAATGAATANGPAQTLVAEGPLPAEVYEGAFGSPAPNHGLPRFANAGSTRPTRSARSGCATTRSRSR